MGQRVADNKNDQMKGAYLGPEFSDEEILSFLKNKNIEHKKIEQEKIPKTISDLIADEKVIGWFQGRMEFGPRALGSRTIIGDARSPKIVLELS